MGSDVDTGVVTRRRPLTAGADRTLPVALGRRVEVIGDLLLPPEPTDSSRAACRDIARRLEEWQGPGIVILCGRLVAPGLPGRSVRGVVDSHPELTDALGAFAARADSQVVAVMAPAERDPELVQALERRGVTVRDGGRPRVRDGRGHAHGAGARRHAPARRQPAHRRRARRRPALAGRHGAPRRPAAGPPLRHLAPALPAAAPLPLGAAAGAGRRSRCCCASSSWSTASAASSARPASRTRSSAPTTPPGSRASS